MRTLVVVRHAKAEGYGEADHARRLTERGQRDATEAGRWLAARGVDPDLALVSSAARAKGTWEALAQGGGWSSEVSYDDALYSAGPDAALDVLREADPEIGTLVFVGHNPTAAYLANLLSDGTPEPDVFRAMAEGYPPAAVAVFETESAWADLDEAGARVVAFHVGRG